MHRFVKQSSLLSTRPTATITHFAQRAITNNDQIPTTHCKQSNNSNFKNLTWVNSAKRHLSTGTSPLLGKCVVNGPPQTNPVHQEIVDVTCELMTSIYEGDYGTYVRLCDDNMTCFEPETSGNLISGMPFHKYYFDNLLGDLNGRFGPLHTTIVNPHVVMLSEGSAYICYNFLIQMLQGSQWVTVQRTETRIWKHEDGVGWRSLHFHKSIL